MRTHKRTLLGVEAFKYMDLLTSIWWHQTCKGCGQNMDRIVPAPSATSGQAMDRAVARRSRWPRRALLGVPVLVTAVAVASWLRGSGQSSVAVAADRITTARVVSGRFDDFVAIRGRVSPLRTIFVDTAQGGQVEAIHVEDGATVKRGQLLVDLSNTALQLDLISREAQITEQLNNLRGLELAHEQARLNSRRDLVETEYQLGRLTRAVAQSEELVKEGASPRAELDDSNAELRYYQRRLELLRDSQGAAERLQKAQVVQLRTAAQQLERNLEVARRNLDTLHVRAPSDGQLSAFTLEVGQSLRPGDRLAQIDVPHQYKLIADLDEFYLNRVDIDQTAEYPVAGKNYPLRVRKLRPQVQDGRFQIELEFVGQSPPELRRGQTAQTRLQLGQAIDATLIPNAAFYNDTGGAWVFVVTGDGRQAVRRTVRLGRRNPQVIEVLEGLTPGETIVTSGYSNYLTTDRLDLDR
jgi:HlyD family secretion protein